jgi:RNA polymerase sigma factor (sigma-70 family)
VRHSYADPEAWEELYCILWPWLLAKAHTRLRGDNIELAEDISQEVMLRLLRRPEFGDDAARFRGYVRQICDHLVIDEMRKRNRDVPFIETDVPAPNADKILELTLSEAIGRLEDEDSLLLDLLLKGATPPEIARELNRSVGTIYNNLSNLRRKLRRLVEPRRQDFE